MSCPIPAPTGDPPVDPRGVRFTAAVTSVVLALTLLSGSGWLLAAQGVVFALGAFAGLRFSPYAVAFRALIAPRLGAPSTREPAAPLRFSQTLGFAFTVVGTAGYLTGLTVVGIVATAFALVAALLNAAFGFCLGCQLHALIARFRPSHKQGAIA
jgi:hypothetical protein